MTRLYREIADNVRGIIGMYRMTVSPDWPNVRVEAALEADRRVRRYEEDRAGRLALYAENRATVLYIRQWRRRNVVLNPDRFSRASVK